MAKQLPETAVIFRAEGVLFDNVGNMIPHAIKTVGEASKLVNKLGLVVTFPKDRVFDPWFLAQFDSVRLGEPDRAKLQRSSTDQPPQLHGLLQSTIIELGAEPDATTVVETNPSGIEIAKSLGCFVIEINKDGYSVVETSEGDGHTIWEDICGQLADHYRTRIIKPDDILVNYH